MIWISWWSPAIERISACQFASVVDAIGRSDVVALHLKIVIFLHSLNEIKFVVFFFDFLGCVAQLDI